MFVDASVIIAVITREEGWEAYSAALNGAKQVYASPLCRWEAVVGLRRKRKATLEDAQAAVDGFFSEINAELITISSDVGRLAEKANDQYGKNRHPASLNFGDCFSYACAKAYRLPLLYKGNDFSQTDLA